MTVVYGLIVVIGWSLLIWFLVWAIRKKPMFVPVRYYLSKEGLPKAPWAFIRAIKELKTAHIIIPQGVGLKRVRDFLDGLAMCIASEIGETMRNKLLVPEEAKYTAERVETKCPVVLKGFRKEGETELEAEMRLVLEAGQRLNQLEDIRAHFE